jgi:UTP--glucose-1-phosphate uridylyltransferase
MRRAGLPAAAIATFARHYRARSDRAAGLLPDSEIEPVQTVAEAADLGDVVDAEALDGVVMVKLNGGLGTSMGMSGPKSLIEARDGLSFLDIVVRQVLALRRRHRARLPLVLMNSLHTREASLHALAAYPELASDVPPDFLQHQAPRLRADDLEPIDWPEDPDLEWYPLGHGDVFTALSTSGMLDRLLERGYRWMFASNIDNLGASLDARILGWFAASGAPFAMEVVIGTEADRKGGHIARRSDGRLVLRETAQTPPQDAASFRDFRRWRYYNSNNLWVDLRALAGVLTAHDGLLELPLIVNHKTVDPRDPSTPEVIQLETAMGAAISVFDGATAILVSRRRFAPVKTTNDLLVLRSDVYRLGDEALVEPVRNAPFVDLDPEHYARIADFETRFPHGAPSLAGCERFVVRGDVRFGAGVVARGRVELEAPPGAPLTVPDSAVLGDPD